MSDGTVDGNDADDRRALERAKERALAKGEVIAFVDELVVNVLSRAPLVRTDAEQAWQFVFVGNSVAKPCANALLAAEIGRLVDDGASALRVLTLRPSAMRARIATSSP